MTRRLSPLAAGFKPSSGERLRLKKRLPPFLETLSSK
jgi:hypothetical protein